MTTQSSGVESPIETEGPLPGVRSGGWLGFLPRKPLIKYLEEAPIWMRPIIGMVTGAVVVITCPIWITGLAGYGVWEQFYAPQPPRRPCKAPPPMVAQRKPNDSDQRTRKS